MPGIRDLRTPLAIGYLWIAVVWVNFGNDTQLQELRENSLIKQIIDSAEGREALALAVGLAGVAYLVGVAWQLFGELVVTLLVLVLLLSPVGAVLMLVFYVLDNFFWQALILSGALLAGVLALRKWSSTAGPMERRWERARVFTFGFSARAWRWIRRVSLPNSGAATRYAVELLEGRMNSTPRSYKRLIHSLNPAALALLTRWHFGKDAIYPVGDRAISGAVVRDTIRLLARGDTEDASAERSLRAILLERVRNDPMARRNVLVNTCRLSDQRSAISEELRHAETQLIAQNGALHQEFDRLQAEGEFRMGVALPMAALTLSVLSSLGGVGAGPYIVMLIIFVFFYVQGFLKISASQSLLISTMVVGTTRWTRQSSPFHEIVQMHVWATRPGKPGFIRLKGAGDAPERNGA